MAHALLPQDPRQPGRPPRAVRRVREVRRHQPPLGLGPDFGWHSFGTRRDEFDLSEAGVARFTAAHAHLHECVGVFRSTLAEGLETVFAGHEAYRGVAGFRVFTEFLGPNSFAGLHKADDPKRLVALRRPGRAGRG